MHKNIPCRGNVYVPIPGTGKGTKCLGMPLMAEPCTHKQEIDQSRPLETRKLEEDFHVSLTLLPPSLSPLWFHCSLSLPLFLALSLSLSLFPPLYLTFSLSFSLSFSFAFLSFHCSSLSLSLSLSLSSFWRFNPSRVEGSFITQFNFQLFLPNALSYPMITIYYKTESTVPTQYLIHGKPNHIESFPLEIR